MHSSLLSDLQEAEATVGTAPPAGIPDSSAVVGQVFQLKVPMEMADAHSTVKVTEAGRAALPSWLHWDQQRGVLEGLPLDADRGVHYISVSGGDGRQASPDVAERPLTVLTVILDADLTKLDPRARVQLLSRMQRFSGVALGRMRVLPVVNNRLFDMTAFMAGPGNAKKVVETGALLSWTLGCGLDPASVPDLSAVQTPAREGAMSARLGFPVPTRVLDSSSSSSAPIQPSATRLPYVLPTASPTPPSSTRRPKASTTKKPKRPRTSTPAPREPRPSSSAPSTTPKPPPKRTAATSAPGLNQKPVRHNPIDEVSAWVGAYFEVKIPSDTFFDPEDGTTDNLRLTLRRTQDEAVGDGSWIQFNSTSQLLYGLPEPRHLGTHEYFLQATDKGGQSATDAFEISLVKRLAYALGDRNSSALTLRNITHGSILVEWTNSSLPASPCPRELIQALSRRLANATGHPTAAFANAMEPDFRPLDVASTDDVYLHTVIPAVVVAAILLVAGVVAMACYRKKRRGKLTVEDQATFIKKGVPIIFADELDEAKAPPSSSMPLILQEEKPPLPPPEYPSSASPETTPLNPGLLGDYEDPNAPPYQPPPPFVAPMEGKGSRPKNMTPYRSPPPYVPP
ncbi:hypothetical protein AAFF_G00259590 [Aldrovandia affinis]|uniref:Dystroglycan 1 n=1 Tax=Aldrovandia affinis TaxID=143900 RepID=A0AAD7RC07_9TELE|nr:hypothetical protein AAFF_G00259590 [Aldrovandia affinis]